MIIINENIKDNVELTPQNFPKLFAMDIWGKYYLYQDFCWKYDENYNILIETIISDKDKLKERIKKEFNDRKQLVLTLIDKYNKELKIINEILEEE